MTQICVSLREETTAGIIDRMVDLAPLADMFEVRGDLVSDLDLLTILRAKTKPLLFTCLPRSEGGAWPDEDPNRQTRLLEAAKRGFDYVDVNFRSDYMDAIVEKAGHGLVLSYHDLKGLPDDLEQLYAQMAERGADIVKIAVTPQSVADVGRLLGFAAHVAQGDGPPLIPIAMGPLGAPTRLLGGRYQVPFTFACAQSGAEAAPGQIPVDRMAQLYRIQKVDRDTKVYGILGRDIGHSLSPVIHNSAFAACGLNAIYIPLEAEALAGFIEALPALGLSGFSVTRPYKVEIMKYLQEIEETAAVCESVNTVVVRANGLGLQGLTTDGVGVLAPIKKRIDVRGERTLILGAGGAARSAAQALHKKGAQVTVLARDPGKAEFVAATVGCAAGDLADLARYEWSVLINATPVGSGEWVDATPVPKELIRPKTVVLDMVYFPLETRLLREARDAGAYGIDGLEMLLAQAIGQFETWTGVEAPEDVMQAALFDAIGERTA
ncbi:MAG: shikimate dehydrogenase [Vicinamibacteria bacterium]|jgi:shikimate dehydrogenase/3-dehydroquinate dehydratase type I|nr:shikimate dehydrogenase [Vicinamibacteria bacterium]